MQARILPSLVLGVVLGSSPTFASGAAAQEMGKDARIAKALSAGPEALVAHATVQECGGAVLRQGDNGYTCFPDMGAEGRQMCLDGPWVQFLEALIEGAPPPAVTNVAVGYWLQGEYALSNESPEAEGGVMFDGSPHIALLVPEEMRAGLPTTPPSGAPWVMWADTPYAHVMVLVPRRPVDVPGSP
jgi:hypothetical protein